jgi:hypothetical protein
MMHVSQPGLLATHVFLKHRLLAPGSGGPGSTRASFPSEALAMAHCSWPAASVHPAPHAGSGPLLGLPAERPRGSPYWRCYRHAPGESSVGARLLRPVTGQDEDVLARDGPDIGPDMGPT